MDQLFLSTKTEISGNNYENTNVNNILSDKNIWTNIFL